MRAHLHSFWQTSVRCGQHFGACLGIIALALNAEPLFAASPVAAARAIKVTTETKAQADAILRAIFNLEKQQSKNTTTVDELRAELVPFGCMGSWTSLTPLLKESAQPRVPTGTH